MFLKNAVVSGSTYREEVCPIRADVIWAEIHDRNTLEILSEKCAETELEEKWN